jgi:hypothetical protein
MFNKNIGKIDFNRLKVIIDDQTYTFEKIIDNDKIPLLNSNNVIIGWLFLKYSLVSKTTYFKIFTSPHNFYVAFPTMKKSIFKIYNDFKNKTLGEK